MGCIAQASIEIMPPQHACSIAGPAGSCIPAGADIAAQWEPGERLAAQPDWATANVAATATRVARRTAFRTLGPKLTSSFWAAECGRSVTGVTNPMCRSAHFLASVTVIVDAHRALTVVWLVYFILR